MRDLVEGMIHFENGSDDAETITDQEITDGIDAAEMDHPDIYTIPAGVPSAAPGQQPSQPKQSSTPAVPSALKPQVPTLPSAMQTAGFGQNAIDFITNSKIGWVEVGIAAALLLLIFRPKLEI